MLRDTRAFSAEEVIRHLDLVPLPEEGGYYRETYRSAEQADFSHGRRHASTCIYYLVTEHEFSALHSVKSDEIFHFYAGSAVEMAWLTKSGEVSKRVLGSNVFAGECPQVVVPKGVYQGTRLLHPGEHYWALLGCTVSPGFDFADFDAPGRKALLARFPEHASTIDAFTRPDT